MMYEEPKIEFVEWNQKDVITLSVQPGGDGDSFEDSWAN